MHFDTLETYLNRERPNEDNIRNEGILGRDHNPRRNNLNREWPNEDNRRNGGILGRDYDPRRNNNGNIKGIKNEHQMMISCGKLR